MSQEQLSAPTSPPPPVGSGKPVLTVETNHDPIEVHASDPFSSNASTPHHQVASSNVFVAGIPSTWDEARLREIFEPFGEIQSMRIVSTRHYAFVMYKSPASAEAAIANVHLTRPVPGTNNVLHVTIAMHDEGAGDVPNERLFIRGLPQWVSKDHVREALERYGEIVEVSVLMNQYGLCKGAGFVSFKSVDDATTAIKDAHNIRIENWDFPLEIKYSETAEARQQRQMRNFDRLRKSAPSTPSNQAHVQHQQHHQQQQHHHLHHQQQQHHGQHHQGVLQQHVVSAVATSPSGGAAPSLPSYHAHLTPTNALRSPHGAAPFPLIAPQMTMMMPLPPQPLPAAKQTLSPPMGNLQPHLMYGAPGILATPPGMQAPPPPPPQMMHPAPIVVPGPGAPFPTTGDLFLCGVPGNEQTVRQLLAQFGPIEVLQPAAGVVGGYVVRLQNTPMHVQAAQMLNGTTFSTGHVMQSALIA